MSVISLCVSTWGTDHTAYERLRGWSFARDLKAGRNQTSRIIEAFRRVVMDGAKNLALPDSITSFSMEDQPDCGIDGILFGVATGAQGDACQP